MLLQKKHSTHNLNSRTGSSSKTCCLYSPFIDCLLEAGMDSPRIAILPKSEIEEYKTLSESKRSLLNSNLHKGFTCEENRSVTCLEIIQHNEDSSFLCVGGDKGLEVFQLLANLQLKKMFFKEGKVYSLKGLDREVLLVGRGDEDEKVVKGKKALVVLLPTIKLNDEANFVIKKTSSLFFSRFNTSITGVITKDSNIFVIGVSALERDTLLIENLNTSMCMKFKAHTMNIYSLALEPNSNMILSGGWDKCLVTWKILKPFDSLFENITDQFHKEKARKNNFHKSWITHLQVKYRGGETDEPYLLTGSFDHFVKIVSIDKLDTLFTFDFKAKVFSCAMFDSSLWIVGDDPIRIQMNTPVDVKGGQINNLKQRLRTFMGKKVLDLKIMKNLERKSVQLDSLKMSEKMNYQILLEESENTIRKLEEEKFIKGKEVRQMRFENERLGKEKEDMQMELEDVKKENESMKSFLKEIEKIVIERKREEGEEILGKLVDKIVLFNSKSKGV